MKLTKLQIAFLVTLFSGFVFVVILFNNPPAIGDIYSPTYVWADTIAVTQTVIDSLFNQAWIDTRFWFYNIDGWVKIGAPDTTNWASRDWIPLASNQIVNVSKSSKLRRLAFKANGSGTFVIVGIKRSPQW